MRRFFLGISLVAMATGVAAANPPAAHATAKPQARVAGKPPIVPNVHILTYKVAPADEYFGKLKMSILGIRNTIKDQGLKIDSDPTKGPGALQGILMCEDAMHDWEHKYPRDTWIPGTIFTLERLYAKVDSDVARSKAKATMVWLVHDFPRSPQAKIGKEELAANQVGVKPAVTAATTTTSGDADASAPMPSATR